jgi:hypothetical protein
MYVRALAGNEKADHASTLDTVNNLGNLYYAQGKLAEAANWRENLEPLGLLGGLP